MDFNNITEIGRIKKTHGKDGKLIIPLDTDIDLNKEKLTFIIVEINNRLIPFFILDYSWKQDYIEVKFEDIDTPESARTLIGCYAFVENAKITGNNNNISSFRELIGYSVSTTDQEEFGTIEDVIERPEQALLKIIHKDKEILIPAVNEFIEFLDRDNRSLRLNIPPGLTDLNK